MGYHEQCSSASSFFFFFFSPRTPPPKCIMTILSDRFRAPLAHSLGAHPCTAPIIFQQHARLARPIITCQCLISCGCAPISVHSVWEIGSEVSFAQTLPDREVGSRGGGGRQVRFLCFCHSCKKLNHDPPPPLPPCPKVKRMIAVGPVGSMVQPSVLCILISPRQTGVEKKQTNTTSKQKRGGGG